MSPYWRGNLILFLCSVVSITSQDASFYGGSISYKLEQISGKKVAHIDIISGWELGKGPCGTGCSKHDVNSQTNAKRAQKVADTGLPTYYGSFTSHYFRVAIYHPVTRDLNAIVQANYSEQVIGVSETAKWEQELMRFSFEMVDDAEDVRFDGKYWRPLNQSKDLHWHLQTTIDNSISTGTGAMNNGPITFTKTFYRVKLGETTAFRIPMIDPDGDLVKCELGKSMKGGNLPQFPGITVQSEGHICKVTLNASRVFGYTDGFWLAIPITLRDINREATDFGFYQYHYEPGVLALSNSSTQFAVQILDNLETVEFVSPTRPDGYLFIVYIESTWSEDIYAKAPTNTTIDEFIPLGRDFEQVTVSNILADKSRDRVKYTTMSWTPTKADIGPHILCIRAVDTTGTDTDEQRCFTLEVRADTFNHSTTVVQGKPYFIDIPSPDQFVNCAIGATCLLPIRVKSSSNLNKIEIVQSHTDETTVGGIDKTTGHDESNSEQCRSIPDGTDVPAGLDLRLSRRPEDQKCRDQKWGSMSEWFKYVYSEVVCISVFIKYPDACLSNPCQNSGSCITDEMTGTFLCKCGPRKHGTFCEKSYDVCSTVRCYAGDCYEFYGSFKCDCDETGREGRLCEIITPDYCTHTPCNASRGSCYDTGSYAGCDCFKRYSDYECDIDLCPTEGPGVVECPIAGCSQTTCSSHGVCSNGGVCKCRLGFNTDTRCTTRAGLYPGVTSLQFVKPSPMDRSEYICFQDTNVVRPCHIQFFVATTNNNNITWALDISEAFKQGSSIENVQKSTVLQGIDNLYSADVVVRGIVNEYERHYLCIIANDGSSEDGLCVKLIFQVESNQGFNNSNASVKFLEPTPVEGNVLSGIENETYTVILYTSLKTPCENVISTNKEVTVFPTFDDGLGRCVTEARFVSRIEYDYRICFLSAKADYEKRCFIGYGLPDPCSNSPCQNKGHCLRDNWYDDIGFHCFCHGMFEGQVCEEGPCPVNNCLNEGYCKIYNGTQSNLCKAGYTGQHCEFKSSDKLPQLTFTDMAKPMMVQCAVYHPCSLTLLVTGNTAQRPMVKAGYVSQSIQVGNISLSAQETSGSFQVGIEFQGNEVGEKDMCIQSMDANGVNIDEVCFKVNVITDVAKLYVHKDRPHFLHPSLYDGSRVECMEDEPCHVIYHVTTGNGNEQECISVSTSENNEIYTSHMFTSCEQCTPGNATTSNCTVDVSIASGLKDVGSERRFCLVLGLVNSNIKGEERCFNLSVVTNGKIGCQKLHCKNGGFCDGHVPDSPVCQCKSGYSGNDCSKRNINVELFADIGFSHLISSGSQRIHIGDEVFVKVSTTVHDWNTKMRLHTCVTGPERNSFISNDVTLIKDGCEIDQTTHIISQSTHETRFVFLDIKALTNNDALHVFCNATFCNARDYSPRCTQSCNSGPAIVG